MHPLRRPSVFVPLLGALASAFAAHCGDDSTGRARITITALVHGVDPALTTSTGWRVTLSDARIVLGPLRWYEGAALFGRTLFERLVGVSVAYAHPGHYVAGEALADITARRVVDLLRPEGTALPAGNGVTGIAQSAAIELRPAEAALEGADTLHGGTLYVRGVAAREGRTLRFDAAPALTQVVQGIPTRGDMRSSGRWDITIDVGAWIDRADFSTVPAPADPEAVVTLTEGQALNAITRTAPAASGFRLAWTPTP